MEEDLPGSPTNNSDSSADQNIPLVEPPQTFQSSDIVFKINKKIFFPTIILLITLGLLALAYQYGLVKLPSFESQPGKIAILISDGQTKKNLKGVEASAGHNIGFTDNEGRVEFKDLTTGQKNFTFVLTGYQGGSRGIDIRGGENGIVKVELQPLPPTMRVVNGQLLDEVDKTPIKGVTINLGDETSTTQDDGSFTFPRVKPGQSDLKIEVTGYQKIQKEVNVAEEDVDLGVVSLMPSGRIVFVSNRDGNKAIYASNLDESSVKKLIDNQKETDDYSAYLSANKSYIVFFSNRDQVKDQYGNIVSRLYFSPLAGRTVTKVSDDNNPSYVTINDDSGGLIYATSTYDNLSRTNMSFVKNYDFSTQILKNVSGNDNFKTSLNTNPSIYFSSLATSPDSTWIIFYASVYATNYTTDPSFPSGLYIVQNSGSNMRLLSKRDSAFNLKFSEDGGSVIYDTYTNDGPKRFRYDLQKNFEQEIARPANAGDTSPLGDNTISNGEAVSSDGAKIAFRDFRDGKWDLFVKDKNNTNEKRVTNIGGINKVFWLTNRYLIFSVQKESESAAYIVGLTTKSQPLKITDINDATSLVGLLP